MFKKYYYIHFVLWMTYATAQCPPRDLNAAAAVGRPCRKDCSSDSSKCKNGKVCLCDHECGYSCINLGKFCSQLPAIPNAEEFQVHRGTNRLSVPSTSTQFLYDDVAEYICSPGYVKQVPTIPHYCHGRSGWTGSTVCILSCRRYNFRKARAYNLVCGRGCQTDQHCDEGLRCLCDGYCGRSCVNPDISCGRAPPAENTRITYTGEGFQRRAYYTCTPGFYLRTGDYERKCTGGGTWDGIRVSCRRITCGNPLTSVQLMGGRVINGLPGPFYVGHEITLWCSSGRRILGSGKRTCLESGLWSGEDTVCDIIDDEIRCPHPGIPINGRLTQGENFSVGNFVEFECDPGYVMIGEARQECYYFLEWSD
ncbi:protein lev-9-like [Clavelina lepadiformis]|uniref:protein lev-9-like n=1 Tax=Clavelina lepadiformis TaxID=159417 RepID=UPI00404251F8